MTSRKPDWFLVGMAAAVGLAWLWPAPGAHGGILHPEKLTKIGVALVFFLHGLSLAFAALRAGMRSWRVHLLVQGCSFAAFPLLGWALFSYCDARLPKGLGLGFFFLCALPSTVSSSVAMTAAARGNVAIAIFNATASSLLGLCLTPLWLSFVMPGAGDAGALPLGQVMLDLVLWLLLPLIVGQSLRPWLGGFASRHTRGVHLVDRGTILLLVYTSFCDSMRQGVWSGHGIATPFIALGLAALLLLAVLFATDRIARAMGLADEDRIAAVFCGSKKSLAQGVPMARLMFGGDPRLGLILLPILLYHPLQLFVCGLLATRWAKRAHPAKEAVKTPCRPSPW